MEEFRRLSVLNKFPNYRLGERKSFILIKDFKGFLG